MNKTLNDFISEARAEIEEINIHQLENLQNNQPDLLIIDVREAEEFKKGHIPGALLIPRGILEGAVDQNNPHRKKELADIERTLVVVCDSGGRSALAVYTLQLMGFESVYNLAGGMKLWEAEDLPMETGL